jgi:hypothetical protein
LEKLKTQLVQKSQPVAAQLKVKVVRLIEDLRRESGRLGNKAEKLSSQAFKTTRAAFKGFGQGISDVRRKRKSA